MSVTAESSELDGLNLLKPGKTPHQNLRFLLFLAAVLKGVHKHAGLLRAGIASSGNEHRLGANEAPPAIISVFMGDMLTKVIEEIAAGKSSGSAEQQMIKLGVARLPEVTRDNTDRNRTSPFAFTGQKFEFRAVGSSASIAFPVALLNVVVADTLGEITDQLRETLKKTKSVDDAVIKVVREAFKESTPVRFEGNNYSEEWVKEAKKRGLPNIRRTPEALKEMVSKQSRALLTKHGVLTKEELESRYHVRVERYVKDMLIELHTMREMVDTLIAPAAYSYLSELSQSAAQSKAAGIAVVPQIATANKVGELVQELQEFREDLSDVIARVEAKHEDPAGQADMLTSEGADTMAEVRKVCDALELVVGDDYWPLPKYREMLFPV
jgi:glutamine synthetase